MSWFKQHHQPSASLRTIKDLPPPQRSSSLILLQFHAAPTDVFFFLHLMKTFPQFLQEAAARHRSPLQLDVIDTLLEEDDPFACARDVQQHGCINGTIGSLIYYTDTFAFCDRHYMDIEDLRRDYDAETEINLEFKDRYIKNDLAWFAFEYIVNQLLGEYEDLHQ